MRIGSNCIEYVKKTRVLGLVLDENLEYNMHASSTLQNCWYNWLQISWQGGRNWGLNTSSLLILFKTIILTKLFYASPIWLSNNLDKFRMFWSSALLRITGAQYHPQKDLAELGLQLPSLDLQLHIMIVKFVLKCLRASDDCSATILQLQENQRHPFYFHTLLTKKYLACKKEKQTKNIRAIDLAEVNQDLTIYSKEDMKQFLHGLWKDRIKYKLPGEIPKSILDNMLIPQKILLFNRHSKRSSDSITMDYIHGHARYFKEFAKAIGECNSPICDHCDGRNIDSPYHRLFVCPMYNNQQRDTLINQLTDITNFKYEIILSRDEDLIKAFKEMVATIQLLRDD